MRYKLFGIVLLSIGLVLSSYMSLFSCFELFSKNRVDKVLRFSFGIGLNIRDVGLDGNGSVLANSVFGGYAIV